MYLSPSQYNDFLPDSRSLEKSREARYGVFIFCSVLLHLVLLFCFISLNQEGRGYLLPGEKVVEVNLLSIGKTLNPVKSSSNRNDSAKDIRPVKHVSNPPGVIKLPVKPDVVTEKAVQKPVIFKKEIEPPENRSESPSTTSPEVVRYQNNSSAAVAGNIAAAVTENIPVNHEVYEQNSMNTSGEFNGDQVSKDNGTISQGQHYVDENFYYVKDLITRNLVYPVVARRMKWQGTVEVSFVVLETGNVENIRIVASSGHSVLDKNVVDAIQQVQPFPPPPVVAEFIMPIKYTLKP